MYIKSIAKYTLDINSLWFTLLADLYNKSDANRYYDTG